MNFIFVTIMFVGTLYPTAYRSVPHQTKPTGYHWTASGERVNVHGCAVSQDLLRRNGGPLVFGDLLYIHGVGFKFVNDVMHARHKGRVDIWVATHRDERAFDKTFSGKYVRVWLIRPVFKKVRRAL